MSAEPYVDERAARPLRAFEAVPASAPEDRTRPNVSGDLPSVFQAAPMFRRAVAGYDRFQVDAYVRWAEDELATADREREHLMTRHLRTQADLDQARQLLSHTAAGGEFLQLSRRMGSMLAAAADEAEGIRREAEAHRSAATAQANRKLGYARWRIAYADDRATFLVAEAARKAAAATAAADLVLDEAERTRREARAEADARLAEVRAMEQRAAEDATRTLQQARREALAARLQAREEVVRLLSVGRESRLRADAEATATRERLDRDAAVGRTALVAEIAHLEHRRSELRAEFEQLAEVEQLAERTAGTTSGRLVAPLHGLVERLAWRSRSLRAR
ncbi:MAG: hypothetical protein JWR45_3495 [Blastococcus sp.]|nr:hypothetical protein [Blastococcus sp.]